MHQNEVTKGLKICQAYKEYSMKMQEIQTSEDNINMKWNSPGFKTRTDLRAGKPLGDCCADVIHFTGLDRLAGLYTQLTGKDCGCKDRQNWLNRLMPKFFG